MADGAVFGFGFFEGGELEAIFLEEADELEFFFLLSLLLVLVLSLSSEWVLTFCCGMNNMAVGNWESVNINL